MRQGMITVVPAVLTLVAGGFDPVPLCDTIEKWADTSVHVHYSSAKRSTAISHFCQIVEYTVFFLCENR